MKVEVYNHGRWHGDKLKGVFVSMSPREALGLIQTLAQQLANEDPNSGRIEFSPRNSPVSYFSMCIDFEGVDTISGIKRYAAEEINKFRDLWHKALEERTPAKRRKKRA
jgi:hypothetical protein